MGYLRAWMLIVSVAMTVVPRPSEMANAEQQYPVALTTK
jgi:hypothetical protein